MNKGENQLDVTNCDLLVIKCYSTFFHRLYAHHQEIGLCFTAYGFCPVKGIPYDVLWKADLYCIVAIFVYVFGVFSVGK